jgi:hypothetical protein
VGIEKFVEEAAGAFAADQALEAVDPNAGILAKGAAAIAGFEGVNKLTDLLEEKTEGQADADQQPAADAGDGDSSN